MSNGDQAKGMLGLSIIAAVAFEAMKFFGMYPASIGAKLLAILPLAWIVWMREGRDQSLLLIALGLLFHSGGDAALEVSTVQVKPWFIVAVALFLMGHLWYAAAFARLRISAAGIASFEEVALMTVTEQWLPMEHAFAKGLIDTMVRENRRFLTGLRYNLPSTRPLACMVASDTYRLRCTSSRPALARNTTSR